MLRANGNHGRWRSRRIAIAAAIGIAGLISSWGFSPAGHEETEQATPDALPVLRTVVIPGPAEAVVALATGETVEISTRIVRPSALPDDARVRVEWMLISADGSAGDRLKPATTNGWSKLLHALDGDVYVAYRAPVAGTYRLRVAPEEGAVDLFGGKRWREAGAAPDVHPAPEKVVWPKDARAEMAIAIRPIDLSPSPQADLFVELEPNDAPEQAQLIPLKNTADDYTLHVVGTSDDIEYFDNGRVGEGGDDWFRLEFDGPEPRLLTACLSIPDQMLAARIRCYALPKEKATAKPGERLPIDVEKEYETGKNPNERVHQQEERHRIHIVREMKPGHVYFLRVEANAPGYELELRVVRPAPFDDPRHAVRHSLYDHIGQVNAWLANRPRGASVERRIRETGNVMGTNCMSCHTQSGVWGPAIPFAHGYRPRNVQLYRELANICYQSMRPTNKLIDAANNTSLPPLDLGDGPAGTRVAGHAVVSLERYVPPRRLQAKQSIRAANFILQSGDPGGINAAGPGANVGQGVVYNYAGEVLFEAWKKTGDPKYFRALEDKARKVLDVRPKYTDDLCHRVELLRRFFPRDYVAAAAKVAEREQELAGADRESKEDDVPVAAERVPYKSTPTSPEDARKLWERIEKAIEDDIARLRGIQNDDGTWGFEPGRSRDDGKTWRPAESKSDPAPTALALIAFEAAGFGPDDPHVAKGVRALLKMQFPSGMWNGQSQTGFVTTSYCLHALSRLYPVEPPQHDRQDYEPRPNESLVETIARVRALSAIDEPRLADLLLDAAAHESPLVRYWAMIGLGAIHLEAGVPALVRGLGDSAKPVREAAHWALRQSLIDDIGWKETLAALDSPDDYVREEAAKALVMRVDGVLPGISVEWNAISAALARGMNDDPHPAVRAWSARAAWNWWVWNPPVRKPLNAAWVRMLERPEANALVENSNRYQSHALFVANGHKANASREHQYEELAELFVELLIALETAAEEDEAVHRRLAERLVGAAATFYNTSGGDGGPGQMGYVTPGAGDLFGAAVLARLKYAEAADRPSNTLLQVTLEGAANVPHRDLQQKLIDYSLNGPEELRSIAASSVSDPRSAQLAAVPELIEPLMKQVERGAAEPARRPQLSDPVLTMFARVKWVIPETAEQRGQILDHLIPAFDEFHAKSEIDALADVARKAQLARRMEADWYVASGLGDAFGKNEDLRFELVLDRFPREWKNPHEARFWLASVPWMLTYRTQLPEVKADAGTLPPADPYEELRSRALRLYLSQLDERADPRVRELAVKLAGQTALRRNPELLTALESLVKFEKREEVLKTARNVLSTGRGNFLADLRKAAEAEEPRRFELDRNGDPRLPAEFIDDFAYFRDHVTPEMNRVLRGDQRSCFACHGVPGRVPTLTLHPPDEAGHLPVDRLLANYRQLQERVDLADVAKSKLLRKPLNVQSGEEDGHQGGRRYMPEDPGYLILKRWAENQARMKEAVGSRQSAVGSRQSAGGRRRSEVSSTQYSVLSTATSFDPPFS
ncbi:MAG: HEAT repeat domain-containing protein [Planctomycetaceae bacterium]